MKVSIVSLLASTVYKKGSRVIVNIQTLKNPEYYVGTVTGNRNGYTYVSFDDGDKGKWKPTKSKTGILGLSINRKRKSEIPANKVDLWLLASKKATDKRHNKYKFYDKISGSKPNKRKLLNLIEGIKDKSLFNIVLGVLEDKRSNITIRHTPSNLDEPAGYFKGMDLTFNVIDLHTLVHEITHYVIDNRRILDRDLYAKWIRDFFIKDLKVKHKVYYWWDKFEEDYLSDSDKAYLTNKLLDILPELNINYFSLSENEQYAMSGLDEFIANSVASGSVGYKGDHRFKTIMNKIYTHFIKKGYK